MFNQGVVLDLAVVAVYFLIIVSIGLWMGRKNRSMDDFALGGRSIPWWAVLASILAAEISAGTFFGVPGDGYALKNYTYIQLIVGYLLARVVVSAFFVPAFYKYNVVSIYEFLGTRFGQRTRHWASGVFLLTRVLASGARLWVPTIMLVLLWHLAYPNTTLTLWNEFFMTGAALLFVVIATSLYTAVGGIKAVIWTDVIQIMVLFCAIGFSLYYLLGHIPGGWEGAKSVLQGPHDLQVWDHGLSAERGVWENIKHVLESEYTIWAAFLGSTFVTLATHGTDQDMVQRMLTAKNPRQSAVATILSGLADIPVVLIVLTIGILLSVYYQANPDPLLPRNEKGVVFANKVFPHFVLTVMPAGLRGLVIAGVLATTMGSLSTALNSLATSYVRDFHFRWFGQPVDERAEVSAMRIGTGVFALFLIGVALGTSYVSLHHPELRILPIILGIFGYTYGSLLGVFIVGLFTKTRGNDTGNLIAMVSGFVVVAYLSGLDLALGKMVGLHFEHPAWVPEIEFPWRIMFGTVVTVAVALCFRSEPAKQSDRPREA